MGSSHGYVVDETESARGIFSTVVTGRTYHTESPLGGSWNRLRIVTGAGDDSINCFANCPQRPLNSVQ